MNLTEMIGQERIDAGMWWTKGCGLQLVEGCTKVSPGCDNCWSLAAANMRRFNPNPKVAARYEGTVTQWTHRKEGEPPNWTDQVNPQWQDLDKIGRSRKSSVYTFWTDLFHPGVPDEFIDAVMARITIRLEHFYIICTKRPEQALKYFTAHNWWGNAYQKSLMLMTTVENQAMANKRLSVLLQIPGVLHGVSVEPLLGPISFRWAKWAPIKEGVNTEYDGIRGLDLLIAGGETGPHARPSHPDWFRQARDQAVAAGVPFFFKSWGEWAPGSDARKKTLCVYNDGRTVEFTREAILAEERRSGLEHNKFNPLLMSRVSKKTAGRTLDGRTWEEMPNV
jgi:protein gp37